jgi:hypothetical protein
MKKVTILGICLVLALQISAQSWSPAGKFDYSPSVMYEDTVDGKFWVAGRFSWFDSTEIHGFGYLTGDTVIGIGRGFGNDTLTNLPYGTGVPYVYGLCRFQGDLYATGLFEYAGGQVVNGIAKWGANDWEPIGSGLSLEGDFGAGSGWTLKVINNEMYLAGIFDSINGIEAHGLAKFNGNTWSSAFSIPRFTSTNINRIYDVEWFQGELYIGGVIYQPGSSPQILGLAKWDGNNWVGVGNGMYGNLPYFSRLTTFQNKLILAGSFNYAQNPGSIPGNCITSWDGTNWDTLQGGLHLDGNIADIAVHGSDLYVAGYFLSIGNIIASGIAKWDGNQWCSESLSPSFSPEEIAFFGDTLFSSQGFNCFPTSTDCFAKWTGGQFGDSCQMVGSPEPTGEASPIVLFPNPVTASFQIQLADDMQQCQISIFDALGRSIRVDETYRKGESVSVTNLASGIYFVRILVNSKQNVIRLLKE